MMHLRVYSGIAACLFVSAAAIADQPTFGQAHGLLNEALRCAYITKGRGDVTVAFGELAQAADHKFRIFSHNAEYLVAGRGERTRVDTQIWNNQLSGSYRDLGKIDQDDVSLTVECQAERGQCLFNVLNETRETKSSSATLEFCDADAAGDAKLALEALIAWFQSDRTSELQRGQKTLADRLQLRRQENERLKHSPDGPNQQARLIAQARADEARQAHQREVEQQAQRAEEERKEILEVLKLSLRCPIAKRTTTEGSFTRVHHEVHQYTGNAQTFKIRSRLTSIHFIETHVTRAEGVKTASVDFKKLEGARVTQGADGVAIELKCASGTGGCITATLGEGCSSTSRGKQVPTECRKDNFQDTQQWGSYRVIVCDERTAAVIAKAIIELSK